MALVETHALLGGHISGAPWMVAVARGGAAGHDVALFMATGTDTETVRPGPGVMENGRRNVGGAPILFVRHDGLATIAMVIGGVSAELPVQAAEPGLFAGLNVVAGMRNGESASLVADWLRFHQKHHVMDAALIVNRAGTGEFGRELAELAGDLELARLVVVTPDFPLGRPDLPAEAHPYCAPDAPGKARMRLPSADAWRAPLGEPSIYELLKDLYLGRARAVANIDPSDLIMPHKISVFDAAVASEGGVVMLAGRRCYPWRVRKGQLAGFGDHICVQFDHKSTARRWCLAPGTVGSDVTWRYVRVVGDSTAPQPSLPFMRCMAVRHRDNPVAKIVPKSSLMEDAALVRQAKGEFGAKPVRMPKIKMASADASACRTAIITTMKNEGPFILEWLAYHRVIGVEDFLIYTNDCSDGTDDFLKMLQAKGLVQHRDNGFAKKRVKPQHWALKAAWDEPIIQSADWLICMDVDEFINIKIGDGTLGELYAHMGDANMISCTWRLFGNADVNGFVDAPVIRTFQNCAPEFIRKPHQAWGFKTLFRNVGIFKKLGVHRPKGLHPQLWDQIRWVNGSGKPLPPSMYRNAWRSTISTYGYDVVSLNHYAVRSAESFLVKRERGRVNHVSRDQGLAYWFRMNNNAERDTSIQRMLPKLLDETQRLLQDPEIAAAHQKCVAAHRDKVRDLRNTKAYGDFYSKLISPKMQRLSRMHLQFGAKIFQEGPDVVPDEVAMAGHPKG